MRILPLLALALLLSGCAASLERQAGTAAKADCRKQAEAYVRKNMANIANEWREHEEYKRYQRCLAERAAATS